jgi:DNA-binding IclR family transcriptional regulator
MLRLTMGSRIPIATTAMGRALLAGSPERDRQRLLKSLARREGKKWTKIKAGVERAVKSIETRGFTVSAGEWESDINAVGVPLVPADGSGVFAFNCGAPTFHFSRAKLENEIGPRLLNMVRNIEADLNGR